MFGHLQSLIAAKFNYFYTENDTSDLQIPRTQSQVQHSKNERLSQRINLFLKLTQAVGGCDEPRFGSRD